MKQLTKDPNAISKAERERKANEEAGLKSITLSLTSGSGGNVATKKKPVFKSTLQPHNASVIGPAPATVLFSRDDVEMTDASTDDEAWLRECVKLSTEPVQLDFPDQYDPNVPTRLEPCPFPQCEGGSCRHSINLPARDPRRTLETLLRGKGLPTREPNETWEGFRLRRMPVNG